MISLILAAGKGTRMRSEKPKVLHEVNGIPMLKRVTRTLENIGIENNVFILGHKKEEVLQEMGTVPFVVQEQQLGTGHAILIAKEIIEEFKDDVLITCGDTPLLKEKTLNEMKNYFYEGNYDCLVLSCKVKDSFGYGRIVKKDGRLVNMVEQKDATVEEQKIDEINSGVYMFKYDKLIDAISKIDNNNSQGEYYLPDAVKVLVKEGLKVDTYQIFEEEEILGVNSKVQLAQATKILRNRKNIELMDAGVILIDPETTYIEEKVEIGEDTIIYPNVIIQGETKIGKNCKILSNTRIENSLIGNNVKIESSLIEQSKIEGGVR